jgi:hypothetical protein
MSSGEVLGMTALRVARLRQSLNVKLYQVIDSGELVARLGSQSASLDILDKLH